MCVGILLSGGVFAVTAPPVSNGGLLPGPKLEGLEVKDLGIGQTYLITLILEVNALLLSPVQAHVLNFKIQEIVLVDLVK